MKHLALKRGVTASIHPSGTMALEGRDDTGQAFRLILSKEEMERLWGLWGVEPILVNTEARTQ